MTKFKYIYLSSILVFIGSIFPLVKGYFPIYMRSWIFIGVLFSIILLCYTKMLLNKFLIPFYLYFCVLIFNLLNGDPYYEPSNILVEIGYYLVIPVIFITYIKYSTDFQRYFIVILLGIISLITLFCTSIAFSINPDILREIQYDSNGGAILGLRLYYNKLGVMSYEMGHALPYLVPILVYNIRCYIYNYFHKFLYLILLTTCCLMVYMSTSTTGLAFTFILLILSMILPINGGSIKKVMIIFISAFIFLLLLSPMFISLIELWGSVAEGNAAKKAMEILNMIETGDTGSATDARTDLYQMTIDSFISSPILGVNSTDLGGHTIILDRLATIGLVGTIPLLLFFFQYFKIIKKKLHPNLYWHFVISYLSIMIMSCIKSISSFEYWIIAFFYMPLIFYCTSCRISQYNNV